MLILKQALAGLSLVVACAHAQARDFPVPGFDGYQNMISMLGSPSKVEVTTDGNNYIYPDVVINISGEDKSTILSASYSRPNTYTKYSGLDVGMSSKQVLAKLSDYYEHHDRNVNFITDYERALIFWLEHGKVVKMVQVRRGSLRRIR